MLLIMAAAMAQPRTANSGRILTSSGDSTKYMAPYPATHSASASTSPTTRFTLSRMDPNTNENTTAKTCMTANGRKTWYCATAASPPAALTAIVAHSETNRPDTTMSPRDVAAHA